MAWPVSHSLSPRLHGYWINQYGINGSYLPLSVPPSHFPRALKNLPNTPFVGVNVTLPHKEKALAVVDAADELNPVVRPEYTVSKNFYNISWSIFGNIVTEKWDRNEGLWIERQ